MLLIGDQHPSVTSIVHRMLLQQNVILKSEVADFDGVILRVRVTPDPDGEMASPTTPAAPAPQTAGGSSSHEDEAPPPPNVSNTVMIKADVLITLKHIVPTKVLDHFGNYEAVVSALFPSGTFGFVGGEKSKITVTFAKSAAPAARDSLLGLASQLRIFSYYPLFLEQGQRFLKDPASVAAIRVPYRPTESMYIYTNKKGDFYVTVSLIVPSKDDQLFVKNFLQSFVDVKRLDRTVAAAPGFYFTNGKAPVDIPSTLAITEDENENTFWCNFQLSKLQCEREAKMKETAKQIVNFRNNLMFHIHGCRSYMHALMRQRVETAVRVIERAKTNTTGKAKVQLK